MPAYFGGRRVRADLVTSLGPRDGQTRRTSPRVAGRRTANRGAAVGAARVVAVADNQTKGETIADGAAQFTLALPPGDYELRVSADGFSVFRRRVSLNSPQATVNVTL